jgi:hypothetical protein
VAVTTAATGHARWSTRVAPADADEAVRWRKPSEPMVGCGPDGSTEK